MKVLIWGILTILIASTWSARAEMRIWTDKKGNTIEAEFVDLIAGKVVLKTASGAQRKFPASGFCQADQEYLKSAVPPEIEIEVDMDRDKKLVDSYDLKREKITGKVTLAKKNRAPSCKKLTATLFVLSKNDGKERLKIIDKAKHGFSFETQDTVSFSGNTVTVTYFQSYDNVYWDDRSNKENFGEKYEGYLVVIEDEKGKVVHIKGSRSKYEEMVGKIRKGNKGATFDI